jgi:hypothetical protein
MSYYENTLEGSGFIERNVNPHPMTISIKIFDFECVSDRADLQSMRDAQTKVVRIKIAPQFIGVFRNEKEIELQPD